MIIRIIFFLSFIYFSSSDQILRTNIGQDVTFSCFFENEFEFDQVSFMHQTTGDILSFGLELFIDQSLLNNHMKLIKFSSNRLDLIIYSVNQNDSGLYTCMINDQKLAAFLLEIFIPPRFVLYSPIEGSVSYPEGSSMNLSCRVFSIPSSNITWIYRDKNKQSKIIHNGENIYISFVKSSDSGLYECIASNVYHATISRSFYVTIHYPPRVILKQLIDIINSKIKLNCQICSMPLSNIKWFKNEKDISNDEDFNIKTKLIDIQNEQCLISTLTIDYFSDEKSGRYECRAENILGHNSHHIDFYPKLVSKMRSGNEKISFLTLSNNTYQISNSSECFFRLINVYIVLFLIILSL